MKLFTKFCFFIVVLLINTNMMGQASCTANDACSNAYELTPVSTCTSGSFTTMDVSSCTDEDATGDCTNGNELSIWFKFTSINTSALVIVEGGSGFDAVVGALTACGSTSRPTNGGCTDGTGDAGIEALSLSGLTIGATYYIQVHDYWGGLYGTSANICVEQTPACSSEISAISLSNEVCNDNGTPTDPTDDTYSADVTLTFAGAPTTGNLTLGGTGISSGTYSVAANATSTSTSHTFTNVSLEYNATLSLTGIFSDGCPTLYTETVSKTILCGVEGLAQGSTSCNSLSKLCAVAGTPLVFASTIGADDADVTNPLNNYGCLTTSPGPSWFYIEVDNAGDLTFTLQGKSNTNSNVDNDFALWGPFANIGSAQSNCNSYGTPTDCSYTGGSGSESINITSASSGEVYVLLITSYSSSSSHFTLEQTGGSGTTSCSNVVGVCNISDISLSNIGTCDNNGTTSDNTDDYYTADITVTFGSPETTGTLDLTGAALHSSNTVSTVAVSSTTSTTTHTFSGVRLKADGNLGTLTATFSDNSNCTFTVTDISAVNACSTTPCNASSTMSWD